MTSGGSGAGLLVRGVQLGQIDDLFLFAEVLIPGTSMAWPVRMSSYLLVV
ncbi:hypothetical protein [Nonomuraea sp. NPDC049480]